MDKELKKILNVSRLGLIIFAVFVAVFIIWACLAPLESAAIAPGKVVVAGQRRSIQHLEGGIIRKIFVKDGQHVTKNQVLIQLENLPTKTHHTILNQQLYELMAQQVRLSAQIQGKKELVYDKNMHQHVPEFILRNQQAVFSSENIALNGQLAILQHRQSQLNEQIVGSETELVAAQRQLSLITKELHDIAPLAKQHYISRSQVLAFEREKARLQGLVGEKSAHIATLKEKLGEAKLQQITTQAEQNKKWISELRDTEHKLAQQTEKEKAAKDIYSRTTIRAPQAGIVVGLNVHTVGGVIKPGEVLMQLVPSQGALIIEAKINPLDIDVVHKGLVAKVVLTALQSRSMPTLEGTVETVSADVFTDTHSEKSYYKAEIVINKNQLKKLNNVRLYPGMPTEVMIITSRLTPWQYFTRPIERSFDRAFREQ